MISKTSNTTRQNKKSGKLRSLVILLVSLGVGAGGLFLSRNYIENKVAFYKSQFEKTEPMKEVVVPRRDLLRGEIVAKQDLAVRKIPEQYFDRNSVTVANFEESLGQRVAYDIQEGRPLLWAHLEVGVNGTFSGRVENGLRAMTVRVDEINSISGFLQPQDKIDLFLSYGASEKSEIIPLAQRLNVIATGVQTIIDKNAGGKERRFTTVTLHVSPDTAKKITLAQQVGRVTAVLRNPEDDGSLKEDPMTVAQLLKDDKPPPVKRVVKKKPLIEYIVEGQ